MTDELSPEEQRYFESGGQDTAGILSAGDSGGAPTTDPPATPEKPASSDGSDEAKPEGEPKPEKPDSAGDTDAAKSEQAAAKPDQAKQPTEDGDDDGDEPGDGADARSQRPVPYQRFARAQKKASDRISALETQLREANEKFTRGDERSRILAELLKPEQKDEQAEDKEPDPNEDIIGWVNWSRREIGRLRDGLTNTTSLAQDTVNESRITEAYRRDAAQFATQQPDFGAAYNALLTARGNQLHILGYSDADIAKTLRAEEKGLVERAFQSGKSPAAFIYELAKANGYQPAPASAQNRNGAANGDGGAATAAAPATPAAPAAPPKPSVTDEVARIAAAQAAGKSLSGAGGTGSELSIEALATLSESEFEKLYQSKKGQIERLMAGR